MDAFDVSETDRLVIWLRRCGEDWTEADVIGALALCSDSLREAVRGLANDHISSRFLADNGNLIVILADVHAFYRNAARNFGVIVHDQRYGRLRCNFVKLGHEIGEFVQRFLFPAKLDKIDTPFDHRFSHAQRVGRIYVIEINNPVEPAMREVRHANYSCKRDSVGLSSKFSEDITRSTKPVSYLPA